MNLETGEITGPRVKNVSVSGFAIRGFQEGGQGNFLTFSIDVLAARDATVAGNRVVGNAGGGIGVTSGSINTTVVNNYVIGNANSNASGIAVENSSRTTLAKNTVRNIPEGENAIDVVGATNTTIAGNDLIDNWLGVFIVDTPETKIVSNDMRRSGIVGTYVAGPKSQNAKVVGNNISGGPEGHLRRRRSRRLRPRKLRPRQLRWHVLRSFQIPTRGRLRGEWQHGRGQHAFVPGREVREEILGDRDRASGRKWHGGYGKSDLGQRSLRLYPYLGRGRGLEGPVLPRNNVRRDAETQEQFHNRQPLRSQQA
jgi:parallel beta-helix repeat protein